MTDAARRRSAGLVIGAGICIAILSTVAESIGLGSGNGVFGAWQITGLGVGITAIVGGLVWLSVPQRWLDPGQRHLPNEAFELHGSDAKWPATLLAWQRTGLAIGTPPIGRGSMWYRRATLFIGLAAMVALIAGFFDGDPIDSARTCGELEAAKAEVRSDYGADQAAFAAEVLNRYLDRKSELGCLGLEL